MTSVKRNQSRNIQLSNRNLTSILLGLFPDDDDILNEKKMIGSSMTKQSIEIDCGLQSDQSNRYLIQDDW